MGAVAVPVVGLGMFFPETAQYKNGLLNPEGYPKVALARSITMAIAIWYSAWGTRDQIPRLPKAPDDTPKFTFSGTLRTAFQGYREAIALPSFRAVFLGAACFSIAYGITQTLQTHLNVFFWEFTSKQQAALRLALLPGFLLGISLTRVAHKRFDKKACAMAGLVFITTTFHLPIVLRLLGVLPHDGGGVLLLIVTIFFHGTGSACSPKSLACTTLCPGRQQIIQDENGVTVGAMV
jgi:Na+/melibiose symporter-like transporter